MKKLGADHVINYNEDRSWGETARKLTGGVGVDVVIEIGGAETMQQSLSAVKYEGTVAIIGFVGGAKVQASLLECLSHICVARGVYVGSRQQMEEMVAAIEVNDIHPVVDSKVFSLEQAKEAYEYQVSLEPGNLLVTYIMESITDFRMNERCSGRRVMWAKSLSRLSKPDIASYGGIMRGNRIATVLMALCPFGISVLVRRPLRVGCA